MTNLIRKSTCALVFILAAVTFSPAQQASLQSLQTGTIFGTVLDIRGATVPNAHVVLQGANERRTFVTGDDGFFKFDGVKPGTPVRIEVSAPDLKTWTSNEIVLQTPHFPPS